MIVFELKKQELIKDKLRKPMLFCNDDFYLMWQSKYKNIVLIVMWKIKYRNFMLVIKQ